jgi:hypothetical protein
MYSEMAMKWAIAIMIAPNLKRFAVERLSDIRLSG